MPAKRYVIGLRFGKLQIIEETTPYFAPSGYRARRFICQCDCGNRKTFILSQLTQSRKPIRSCGCLNVEDQVATGDNFWKHVTVTPSGCWEWNLGKSKYGYGAIWINGNQVKAHRHAYELKYGPIPEGMCVCHKCDNPPCINPDHLFLGTLKDNTLDALKKGRLKGKETFERLWATKWKDRKGENSFWGGEKSPTHKLTNEQVIEMRHLYDVEHWGYKRLHKKFGVSTGVCKRIVKRKMWQNI